MIRKITKFMACLSAAALLISSPTSHAASVTPISVQMYSTSGTPVYAEPNVLSNIVMYLDRFVNIRVTGITDTGFYQVDIGGTYYIPGTYMIASTQESKTEKQKALDNLDTFAKAYINQLEQMQDYEDTSFALKDVTGDGVPELISGDNREIYTYYNERAVMIYYSENPITLYYSSKDNKLIGKYTWNSNEYWEVYNKDTTLLPWGQFKCVSSNASSYKDNATEISEDYTNDDETRWEMYCILRCILEL